MPNKEEKIRVLFMAAECAPFAKVGGLADVVGTLPKALVKPGVDVRVIIPLYGSVDRQKYGLKKIYSDLEVPSGRVMIKVNIWQAKMPDSRATVYFVESTEYFRYRRVYPPGDNSERFLFFTMAALYALPVIGFQPNIVHCHDSHVALAPDIIKTTGLDYLRHLKTVYTIHNYYYQGKTDPLVLSTGNLHPNMLKTLSVDTEDGDVNFMVQGIMNADLVTTVSPTYSHEITTAAYGEGLERIIRKRSDDLYGILNGIDTEYFDPQKDEYIKRNYNASSLPAKKDNKLALQRAMGLPLKDDMPVVGLVSRLTWQKGVDLITDKMANLRCQFVFLGSGAAIYQKHLLELAKEFPKQFGVKIGFDLKLAQMIYAGADMFLMPSRFEPCGLGQMIAMRYGTVPVVRATGGLVDTVSDELGFSFDKISRTELYDTLKRSLDLYYENPKKWQAMQKAGMKQDFSWDRSAKEYIKLYEKLL